MLNIKNMCLEFQVTDFFFCLSVVWQVQILCMCAHECTVCVHVCTRVYSMCVRMCEYECTVCVYVCT